MVGHDAFGVALESGGVDGHSRSAAHRKATGDVTTVESVGHEHSIGSGELRGCGHGVDGRRAEVALDDSSSQGRHGAELRSLLGSGIGTAGSEDESDGRADLSGSAEQFGGRLLQLTFGIGGEDDENGILREF